MLANDQTYRKLRCKKFINLSKLCSYFMNYWNRCLKFLNQLSIIIKSWITLSKPQLHRDTVSPVSYFNVDTTFDYIFNIQKASNVECALYVVDFNIDINFSWFLRRHFFVFDLVVDNLKKRENSFFRNII